MEQKQQHQDGGSGFFLGMLLGAAVTLLFTTKKGREIFKSLTEEGVSKMKQKIEETREQFEDFEDMEEGEDYIEPEERIIPEKETRHVAQRERSATHHKEEPKKESRKFFRRS